VNIRLKMEERGKMIVCRYLSFDMVNLRYLMVTKYGPYGPFVLLIHGIQFF
jgi:hypothetical protein